MLGIHLGHTKISEILCFSRHNFEKLIRTPLSQNSNSHICVFRNTLTKFWSNNYIVKITYSMTFFFSEELHKLFRSYNFCKIWLTMPKIFFICYLKSFFFGFSKKLTLRIGRVAEWLAICSRKPKIPVPGSSPATSYVQRWALCSNCPTNVSVFVKRVEVVERN